MPDTELPEIEALHFTFHRAVTVDRWPERTSFTDDWLDQQARHYGATVEGDTLTFDIFNGGAQYTLTDERAPNGQRIAVLVKGSGKKTSRKV